MSEQTALLIKAVRKRPYLFDTSHEYYKNILKKAEAWAEIGAEINFPSELAKVKWKNLRDSYIRHKKSIQNAKGQDKKYVKWPWSTQMMFLDNYNLRSKSHHPRTMGMKSMRTPATTIPQEGTSGFKPLKIPLQKDKAATQFSSAEVFINRNGPMEHRRRNLDAVDHLFLSYAETFKKFRPATQAIIKLQLASLFSRTELNELHDKALTPQKVSNVMTISSPCDGRGFILRSNGAPRNNSLASP